MANPFPFSSGDVLTAANLNSIGEWTSWSPALEASTTDPTNWSVDEAGYIQVNEFIFFYFEIIFNSGFSAGSGTWYVTLPSSSATGSLVQSATGFYLDSSAGNYYHMAYIRSSSADDRMFLTRADGSGTISHSSFSWNTSDRISGFGWHRPV